MANAMSDLGGKICVDGYDGERIITLLADGSAKMGWLVGQTAGAAAVRGVNPTGNLDEFTGIQMRHYKTDIDTAPTAGDPVSVLVPKSGSRYRIHIKDPGGALYVGEPMVWIAGSPGCLDKQGDVETGTQAAYLSRDAANGDTYGEVTWGG